ncbi:hypothetical protein GW932_01180 [archaeon]|nr:hypothetical protein [archaeon]
MVSKKTVKKESEGLKENSNYGLISYILAIVAIVEAIISPMAGIILGIIGLSFSVKEKSKLALKSKKLNIIAIVLGVLLFVAILASSVLLPSSIYGGTQ